MTKFAQTMNTTINERVAQLRAWMESHHLAAVLFSSADDHASEYVAPHFQCRQWISGFDGSAGTAVVTLTDAALWTDSRYFLAATQQLEGTPFSLMREGEPDTPTPAQWLISQLHEGDCVGTDGRTLTIDEARILQDELQAAGIGLTLDTDAAADLWTERPPMPHEPITVQPLEYAGTGAEQKIRQLLHEAHKHHCNALLLTALDEIAWTLNLRGSDVECNPVFYAYLLLEGEQKATLFTRADRLNDEAAEQLHLRRIDVRPYADVAKTLRSVQGRLWIPSDANACLMAQAEGLPCYVAPSPVQMAKAVKNEVEQEGFRRAMARDGAALVRMLCRLKDQVAAGGMTELAVDRQLTAYRAESPLYRGLSFATISAYQEHGAIVHYEPTQATDAPLRPEGLLLLDTGAQYQDGTTDITRTLALGPVSEEMRRVYTLVLKGHIALARARFPQGTTGLNLDLAARYAMWQHGYDFGHGTGHGVGSYLCVHEGPQQIRKNHRACTQVPLLPGMTVTDEPGIYLEGKFGVRIENVLLVTPPEEEACGQFMGFEVLTLCPYDFAAIDCRLLRSDEMHWIDAYHARVRNRLMPLLTHDAEARKWLVEATRPRFS